MEEKPMKWSLIPLLLAIGLLIVPEPIPVYG